MAEKSILVLYLDGPMQAWGYQSRFNRRTSLSYPTKSGVVGLLCAALGVPKSDIQTIAELATLHCEIISLSQSSRWIDFHTVGGGYESGSLHIPRRASGASSKDAAITFREYLADAKFGVLITGDRMWLERCESALHNPTWGVWLGRKCCIPASPIVHGIFSDRKLAISHLQKISGQNPRRTIVDTDQFQDGTDTLSDVPINFARREFSLRRIKVTDTPQQEARHASI